MYVCARTCVYVCMCTCACVCVCVSICAMDICTKDIESDHASNIRYIRVPRLQQTVGNILNDRCVSPSSPRRPYFTVEKFCCGFWFDDTHVVNTSLQWLTTHSLLQYSSSHSLFATAGFGHPWRIQAFDVGLWPAMFAAWVTEFTAGGEFDKESLFVGFECIICCCCCCCCDGCCCCWWCCCDCCGTCCTCCCGICENVRILLFNLSRGNILVLAAAWRCCWQLAASQYEISLLFSLCLSRLFTRWAYSNGNELKVVKRMNTTKVWEDERRQKYKRRKKWSLKRKEMRKKENEFTSLLTCMYCCCICCCCCDGCCCEICVGAIDVVIIV